MATSEAEACWEIHTSKTTGLAYYEHVQTGESSWTLPLGATAKSLDDGSVHSAVSLRWNAGVLRPISSSIFVRIATAAVAPPHHLSLLVIALPSL